MASKTISDTVHGSIKVEGAVLDLLETLEVQRLNAIRQLGLTYLVFPGANHTRLEHVLGTYHVAKEIALSLSLPEDELHLVSAAALLHDIGHGPLSHTLERVIADRTGMDHMEVTKRIILGQEDSVPSLERDFFEGHPRVPDVLERWGLDPQDVANLIKGCQSINVLPGFASTTPPKGHAYLGQIVHSALDADQIDFLLRDSLYTGVAHGIIDLPRLLGTFRLAKGNLVVDRKGLSAVEGTLVARGLMYTSVYFHRTVRIAETMLSRTVERVPDSLEELRFMNDSEMMSWLLDKGGVQRETAMRLKYRRLYKKVLTRERRELSRGEMDRLIELADPDKRLRMENAVCKRAGIPNGKVIIDIPAPELLLTEPRISKVDLGVLEEGKVLPFGKVSPLARAVQIRETIDWVLMVACDPDYSSDVSRAANRVIFR
ncbi:MAG: HD domain-containing protein [Thermoplasmata archaeon]